MTREVVTLAPHHPLREAIAVLARRHFRHLLVAAPGGKLLGVVSDRDLLRFMIGRSRWEDSPLRDVMMTEPVTAGPDTPLSAACAEMMAHRINCLPVVDARGHICGILTSTDLLKSLQRLQESIERQRRAA